MKDPKTYTEQEWMEKLGPEAYRVLRQKGTERPFTGVLNDNKETGMYHCGACDHPLFTSETKFDSGCGWPSFYETINSEAVEYVRDRSHGMVRTEVVCKNCGGHLGHKFPDGPQPTGQRYCMNSISLDFKKG